MKIQDYRQLCQKNAEENYFFDQYIFRRLSIYVTILFIKLHITANQATFMSLLCALTGAILLMSVTPQLQVLAACFIFTYYMLDHVDGELARYYIAKRQQKPSLAGQYFDVLVHKYSTNLMLFFLGVGIYREFHYAFAVFVGFAACVSMSAFPNLLASQVLVQKIANDKTVVQTQAAREILLLLEKKQLQIEKLQSSNPLKRGKKIITEMLFFPGSLLSIMLITLADRILPAFTIAAYPFNLRLVFLLVVTPIYLANTLRQTRKWLRKFQELS